MVRGPLFFQEGQHMCGIAGMIDFEKDLREREKICWKCSLPCGDGGRMKMGST